MSDLMNVTLAAIKENKDMIIAVPAIGIAASIGCRVVFGVTGVSCKVLSKVMDVVGTRFLDRLFSKGIDFAADSLIGRATDSFSRELNIGLGLAALTTTAVGVSTLIEQPEFAEWKKVPTIEEIKKFAGPHVEKFKVFVEESQPIIKENFDIAMKWAKEQFEHLKT
jgi:hypothetical protein